MRIIIAGGSGFIGKAISLHLTNAGHDVVVLTRDPQRTKSQFENKIHCLRWRDFDPSAWQSTLESADTIINLIGENIGQWPWTNQLKKRILHSRLKAGQTISQAIRNAKHKPKILIQASATGFYGNNSVDKLIENTSVGSGFLANVCQRWEESTKSVELLGVKQIILRIGLVLGRNGGMLKKMIPLFKFFIGGSIGTGKQMLPWIHIDDVVEAIEFLIKINIEGRIFNLCTPNPINMDSFTQILAQVMNRPAIYKIPEVVIKTIFGEMARETILADQNAIPRALLDSGYKFKYSQLQDAISDLIDQ
jgi:uncharacterized protein (TIGR01777 family)